MGHMSDDSYRRTLSLYLRYVFRALINSIGCLFLVFCLFVLLLLVVVVVVVFFVCVCACVFPFFSSSTSYCSVPAVHLITREYIRAVRTRECEHRSNSKYQHSQKLYLLGNVDGSVVERRIHVQKL